jgi:hypothetical protein
MCSQIWIKCIITISFPEAPQRVSYLYSLKGDLSQSLKEREQTNISTLHKIDQFMCSQIGIKCIITISFPEAPRRVSYLYSLKGDLSQSLKEREQTNISTSHKIQSLVHGLPRKASH